MPKRILVAEFRHETNSFASTRTGLDSFRARYLKIGQELLSYFHGTKSEVGGFIDACESETFSIVPAIAANAMPGGQVTRDAFEFVQEVILHTLQENVIDGILLSLHGAMVLEDATDGEGELLTNLREAVGKAIPVVCTLDLHGNITQPMVETADILIGYDTNPHVDTYERACEAVKCLAALLRHEIKPIMKLRSIPILCPSLNTAKPPIAMYMENLHTWEGQPRVISVSLFHGFFRADIPEAGMSVLAVTDNDSELADAILADIGNRLIGNRYTLKKEMVTMEAAISRAMAATEGTVVLADVSDNPGGGSTADGTHLLRKLMEMGAKDVGFALIVDPETVSQAIIAGVGATLRVRLGGKVEPINGEPIDTIASVRTITDGVFRNKGPMRNGLLIELGRTVVLDIGSIDVVVTERRAQPMDPEIFRRMGIEPMDKKILVVKSAQHFRAAYEPIAKTIIDVNAPGLASQLPQNYDFRRIRRPIFPLDKDVDFAECDQMRHPHK